MYRHRIASLIFSLLTASAIWGCSDSTGPGATGRLPEGFPDKIGSRWVYSAYDSVTSTPDTVTVEIVGRRSVEIGNQTLEAAVWELSSGAPDTWYVTGNRDTVRIWAGDEKTVFYLESVYVFPLFVGSGWKVPPCPGDTARVDQSRLVILPGGAEGVAYRIRDQGGCLNDYHSNTRWFVPGVGLFAAHWKCFGFCQENRTWDLLSYELPS